VALLRKSPSVQPARCHHFGRCGGCQWQHISASLQRQIKTRLVKDYLKEHADIRRDLVAQTVAGDPWAYRNSLRAVFGERGGEIILGYRAGGTDRVLDISECPVQHAANETMLQAAKDAVSDLRLPIYDRQTGAGLVRGILGLVSFSTGQTLLTISTTAPPPDPTAVVHAFIDRVPGLAGILNTVQPRPTLDLMGGRVQLLWGRDHVDDEIAGFRIRLRPTTQLPASPRATALLVDAVMHAAQMRPGHVALDMSAQTPVVTLALAQAGDGATGVVPGRRHIEDAWDAARWNGVPNALFTAHEPAGVLAALGEHRRPDVVVVTADGPGVAAATIDALGAAGVPRVVYVARSLATCAHDLGVWRKARYTAVSVQPVDLLPQTSHVHLVVALKRTR
jgi:23S rRNA (uracil1939-C5)-methyltransferase